jgi:tetratricopeptide (TPR) repeat protein
MTNYKEIIAKIVLITFLTVILNDYNYSSQLPAQKINLNIENKIPENLVQVLSSFNSFKNQNSLELISKFSLEVLDNVLNEIGKKSVELDDRLKNITISVEQENIYIKYVLKDSNSCIQEFVKKNNKYELIDNLYEDYKKNQIDSKTLQTKKKDIVEFIKHSNKGWGAFIKQKNSLSPIFCMRIIGSEFSSTKSLAQINASTHYVEINNIKKGLQVLIQSKGLLKGGADNEDDGKKVKEILGGKKSQKHNDKHPNNSNKSTEANENNIASSSSNNHKTRFDELVKIGDKYCKDAAKSKTSDEKKQNIKKAKEQYFQAIEINPDDRIWNEKGREINHVGLYRLAIDIYDKIIEKLGDKANYVYFGKGVAHGSLGEYKEAIEAYIKSIKKNETPSTSTKPFLMRAYNNLGVDYWNNGQFEEAFNQYEIIRKRSKGKFEYIDQGKPKGIALPMLFDSRFVLSMQDGLKIEWYDTIKKTADKRHTITGTIILYIQRNYQEAMEQFAKFINNNKESEVLYAFYILCASEVYKKNREEFNKSISAVHNKKSKIKFNGEFSEDINAIYKAVNSNDDISKSIKSIEEKTNRYIKGLKFLVYAKDDKNTILYKKIKGMKDDLDKFKKDAKDLRLIQERKEIDKLSDEIEQYIEENQNDSNVSLTEIFNFSSDMSKKVKEIEKTIQDKKDKNKKADEKKKKIITEFITVFLTLAAIIVSICGVAGIAGNTAIMLAIGASIGLITFIWKLIDAFKDSSKKSLTWAFFICSIIFIASFVVTIGCLFGLSQGVEFVLYTLIFWICLQGVFLTNTSLYIHEISKLKEHDLSEKSERGFETMKDIKLKSMNKLKWIRMKANFIILINAIITFVCFAILCGVIFGGAFPVLSSLLSPLPWVVLSFGIIIIIMFVLINVIRPSHKKNSYTGDNEEPKTDEEMSHDNIDASLHRGSFRGILQNMLKGLNALNPFNPLSSMLKQLADSINNILSKDKINDEDVTSVLGHEAVVLKNYKDNILNTIVKNLQEAGIKIDEKKVVVFDMPLENNKTYMGLFIKGNELYISKWLIDMIEKRQVNIEDIRIHEVLENRILGLTNNNKNLMSLVLKKDEEIETLKDKLEKLEIEKSNLEKIDNIIKEIREEKAISMEEKKMELAHRLALLKDENLSLNIEENLNNIISDNESKYEKKEKEAAVNHKNVITSVGNDDKLTYDDFVSKGDEYFEEGNYEDAKDAYIRAIRINPYDQKKWDLIGRKKFGHKGDELKNNKLHEYVLEIYETIISELNEREEQIKYAYHGKGVALGRLGRYEEAIKVYKKSILETGFVWSYNNLGVDYWNNGQFKEALETLKNLKKEKNDHKCKYVDTGQWKGIPLSCLFDSRFVLRMTDKIQIEYYNNIKETAKKRGTITGPIILYLQKDYKEAMEQFAKCINKNKKSEVFYAFYILCANEVYKKNRKKFKEKVSNILTEAEINFDGGEFGRAIKAINDANTNDNISEYIKTLRQKTDNYLLGLRCLVDAKGKEKKAEDDKSTRIKNIVTAIASVIAILTGILGILGLSASPVTIALAEALMLTVAQFTMYVSTLSFSLSICISAIVFIWRIIDVITKSDKRSLTYTFVSSSIVLLILCAIGTSFNIGFYVLIPWILLQGLLLTKIMLYMHEVCKFESNVLKDNSQRKFGIFKCIKFKTNALEWVRMKANFLILINFVITAVFFGIIIGGAIGVVSPLLTTLSWVVLGFCVAMVVMFILMNIISSAHKNKLIMQNRYGLETSLHKGTFRGILQNMLKGLTALNPLNSLSSMLKQLADSINNILSKDKINDEDVTSVLGHEAVVLKNYKSDIVNTIVKNLQEAEINIDEKKVVVFDIPLETNKTYMGLFIKGNELYIAKWLIDMLENGQINVEDIKMHESLENKILQLRRENQDLLLLVLSQDYIETKHESTNSSGASINIDGNNNVVIDGNEISSWSLPQNKTSNQSNVNIGGVSVSIGKNTGTVISGSYTFDGWDSLNSSLAGILGSGINFNGLGPGGFGSVTTIVGSNTTITRKGVEILKDELEKLGIEKSKLEKVASIVKEIREDKKTIIDEKKMELAHRLALLVNENLDQKIENSLAYEYKTTKYSNGMQVISKYKKGEDKPVDIEIIKSPIMDTEMIIKIFGNNDNELVTVMQKAKIKIGDLVLYFRKIINPMYDLTKPVNTLEILEYVDSNRERVIENITSVRKINMAM